MKDYELYSWILAGTQRVAVIKVMDRVKIPRDIGKECKMGSKDTSRTLRDFVKKGIAECLNEEARTGRLYKLTKTGNALRDEILKEQKSMYSLLLDFVGI